MPQNVFEEKVRNKNPNIIILSEYKGQKEKVKIRCKKCGHEWEANGKSVLEGSVGCRVCAGSFSYSDEEFKKKLNEINPDIIPLEKYVKNKLKDNNTIVFYLSNKNEVTDIMEIFPKARITTEKEITTNQINIISKKNQLQNKLNLIYLKMLYGIAVFLALIQIFFKIIIMNY